MDKLIDLVYAAPFEEEGWQRLVDALKKPFGIKSAYFGYVDERPRGRSSLLHAVNISDEIAKAYEASYERFDPIVEALKTVAKTRDFSTDLDYGSEANPRDNEFYSWFLKVNDTTTRFASHRMVAGGQLVAMCSHRLASRGQAERDEIDRYARLSRHIARALELEARIAPSRAAALSLSDFMERVEDAFVLLDAEGRIIVANDAAERLVKSGDGLRITSGQLVFDQSDVQKRFDGLLARAISQPPGYGTLFATRRSLRRAYIVKTTPLVSSRRGPGLSGARVAVQIIDPEDADFQALQALIKRFGFSAAEARVARELMQGRSDAEICARLGIAVSTVRSHVRSVTDKAYCANRTELAVVLTKAG